MFIWQNKEAAGPRRNNMRKITALGQVVEVAFKTVAHFMAQSHMRGLFACDDHALLGGYMPNCAGHWRGDVGLLAAHADGFGTVLNHIFADFPAQIHLFHDPLVHGLGREFVKL
jgi:hypothetical protein